MEILSDRLLFIAKQVKHGEVICDIGTDHALIPIYLARAQIVPKAYACDIGEKPLERAKTNIQKYEVGDIIEPVLADGLTFIKEHKIDTCIISGLGAPKIVAILAQDPGMINRYIVCPNEDALWIRNWVKNKKYFIETELLVRDNDVIYEIVVINKHSGVKIKNRKDIVFGPILRRSQNALFQEKWLLRLNHYQDLLNKIPLSDRKHPQLRSEIKLINKVIKDDY